MNKPITAKVNEKGHFEIGGCDTVELAKQFGTPLYVLDELTIRDRCRQYTSTLKSKYPNSLVIYACKALCNTSVLKLMADEGLGLDVSSGGELYTAKKAKCDPSKIYFHGNNKSVKEIEEGVEFGVKFVVDNLKELENLNQITAKLEKKTDILFRINPEIPAHTHEFIQTGKIDSKFGISKKELLKAAETTKNSKFLNLIGLHAHIGSQILEINPFLKEIEILFEYCRLIHELACNINELNFGGGLGVSYIDEKVPPISQFLSMAVEKVKEKSEQVRIIFEPGRSIISTAGVTLYTISYIKEIPGITKYAMVDGGMSDNPRPILYDAKYDALIANKANEKNKEKIRIAGRFCESGDVLIKDIELPKIEEGDILAVLCTGAYNYSMASNYNRVGRPAMILANNGKAVQILKRENYDDLLSGDIIT